MSNAGTGSSCPPSPKEVGHPPANSDNPDSTPRLRQTREKNEKSRAFLEACVKSLIRRAMPYPSRARKEAVLFHPPKTAPASGGTPSRLRLGMQTPNHLWPLGANQSRTPGRASPTMSSAIALISNTESQTRLHRAKPGTLKAALRPPRGAPPAASADAPGRSWDSL